METSPTATLAPEPYHAGARPGRRSWPTKRCGTSTPSPRPLCRWWRATSRTCRPGRSTTTPGRRRAALPRKATV
eukprot:9956452-Lingulodinium_polyedra.AAC.1